MNTANLHELVAVRNAVRRTLRLLGTERIDETLSGVIESMPALAQELGKQAPTIEIRDNGYVVHNQISALLKDVFMHLIRNAMDHGIETPDVRLAQGKPAAGKISLNLDMDAQMLNITLRDDGRGLALKRIRQIALDKGLSEAPEQLDDLAAARLILQAGFSTADKVSEVSGRGVGMDAVLAFVSRENGNIDIRFDDAATGADFRQFHLIVALPAAFAVKADEADDLLQELLQTPLSEHGNKQDLPDDSRVA